MYHQESISIVECPRDAMQGWHHHIPTREKVNYLNALLKVGFDTLDFGSFVSPKAIPQMADTAEVINGLDLSVSPTKLLAIVANTRGAEQAITFDAVSFLGFPFSISPTFQLRNTNSTMEESLKRVEEIQDLCLKNNKQLVIYLSMGFGNPYKDPFNEDILLQWADVMAVKGIKIISLADTVGMATPEQISFALSTLIPKYPGVTFGAHLHSRPDNWKVKLEAALSAGCRRLDGALKGIGGCPMAQDSLVGNMDTEHIISLADERNFKVSINRDAFKKAMAMASKTFIS